MSPRLFQSPCGRRFVVHNDRLSAATCPDCREPTSTVSDWAATVLRQPLPELPRVPRQADPPPEAAPTTPWRRRRS